MTILASTVLDVEGGLRWLVADHLAELKNLFDRIVLVATADTDSRLLNDLEAAGVFVVRQKGTGFFNGYHLALKQAVRFDGDVIFNCDFDRILHWIHAHPKELRKTVATAHRSPWIVLERSDRAYRSHHEALYETEQLPSAIISRHLCESHAHDYLSGAFIFDRKSANLIAKKGSCDLYALFGFWPSLLHAHGVKPSYRSMEGLEWETPDRFRKQVARVGLARWREQQNTPAEWKKRTKMARGIVEGLLKSKGI